MLAQSLIATTGRAALLLGAALVVFGGVKRLLGLPPWDARLALWAVAATGVVSILWTLFRRPTLPQTAAAIDRLGQTRDRFLTALAFSSDADTAGLRALAVRECSGFIRGGQF